MKNIMSATFLGKNYALSTPAHGRHFAPELCVNYWNFFPSLKCCKAPEASTVSDLSLQYPIYIYMSSEKNVVV